ncbi:hypothetical protein BCR33DRAFT_734667 [Rhizoclosmatium globosum]|uniref:Uncharacterized protein n=1 Tax=Rhizoclosmatium globosum TaxID=329046 RepID=A0A1Y2CSA0_9FUNG|nr:hypothetical protein BCR33DRAFT_734667 [Rhizoclosmatium globosum]|eukprot:ORY49918.1 hypothetical protein BCR33DRAFT_734667 [Rhizoclosmatium globosum]
MSTQARKRWNLDIRDYENKKGRFASQTQVGVKRKQDESTCPVEASKVPVQGNQKRQKCRKSLSLPFYLKKDPQNRRMLVYICGGDAPETLDPRLSRFMAEEEIAKWRAHKKALQEEYYKYRIDSLASGVRRMM